MEVLQISLAAARVNAVDRSTVRRWEKGDKIPGYDESKKLSAIYNIPLDYIFFGKKSR